MTVVRTVISYFLPPMGREVRKIIALVMIGQGLVYVTGQVGTALGSTPYDNPLDIIQLPLWAIGLIMVTAGLFLLLTYRHRLSFQGRAASVIGVTITAFIAGGFYDRTAPLVEYLILSYGLLRQSYALKEYEHDRD